MDFEKRLEQAIQRGERTRQTHGQAAAERALSEEELRNLHSSTRLNLSEYIDAGMRKLSDHFPGFRFETVVDDAGWGARINRDDLNFSRSSSGQDSVWSAKSAVPRRPANLYSRFQILVKPFSQQTKIVELTTKGTIRNKEVITRSHYQFLAELNEEGLRDTVDHWLLEYAEKFAAQA